MKITFAFIIIAITVLLIEKGSPNTFQREEGCLWHQGQVPYEISHHFVKENLDLIKKALIDIMKATCIKFVPHTNEPDYVVFLEYKHPNQGKGTCWSGNQWNNGTSTVGNKGGRHLVSIWRGLECFNKFGIIREISNILGVQAKSSNLISKKTEIPITYESSTLKKHPYAFDKKEWISITKKDICSIAGTMMQINRIYNCPTYNSGISKSKIKALDHVRPNCQAEAESKACQSDPVYMNSIRCNNFCNGLSFSRGIPPARRANLVNGFGKCFSGKPPGSSGLYQYQWDCNPSKHGMLWSWNQISLGSRDRHICNGGGVCIASQSNWDRNIHLLVHQHSDEDAQRFYFSESLTHPGFYIIQNDYGRCLSVGGNTNQSGAKIMIEGCNPSEAGQRWKWLY